MKRIALVCMSLALAACADSSPTASELDASDAESMDATRHGIRSITVTNSRDNGPGSFRWAIGQASNNARIESIEFKHRLQPIALDSTVTFTGPQAIALRGRDVTLDATNAGGAGFAVTGGGDLSIDGLTVRNAPGEGIAYQVPSQATGTIKVMLRDVTIADNKGHGVLVNDQDHPETEDDVQPDASGSAASLYVEVVNARFLRNGYSVSDRDGIRVNEGAEGSLTFVARGVQALDNAADGIELDERGTGDVRIDVRDTRILRNGKLDPEDLDDGFDIDETDEGSIIGTLVRVDASDNYEEGLDFNENNAGDLRVDFLNVRASNNLEEGIDLEEDDDFAGGGDLITSALAIEANGNGGDGGLKIREKGAGSLTANVTGIVANDNVVSGIAIREDADGSLASRIIGARTSGSASHGIDFDENSTGDLSASVYRSVSTANTGYGVRADQQLTGAGTLLLQRTDLEGNTGGTTTGANVVVTVVP